MIGSTGSRRLKQIRRLFRSSDTSDPNQWRVEREETGETHCLRTWLSYICFNLWTLPREIPIDPLQWKLMARNVPSELDQRNSNIVTRRVHRSHMLRGCFWKGGEGGLPTEVQTSGSGQESSRAHLTRGCDRLLHTRHPLHPDQNPWRGWVHPTTQKCFYLRSCFL